MKVWSVVLPSMCQALFDVLEPKKKNQKRVRDTDFFLDCGELALYSNYVFLIELK